MLQIDFVKDISFTNVKCIRANVVLATILTFSNESNMYGVIADFLKYNPQFRGCKTVVDKVTFNLLKGWRIDVAGVIKEKNNYIVAIEAKNGIAPESILQAISQAEMYQKTCNEVYIALPSDDIYNYRKVNKTEWNRIIDLCKAKGIGIIGIALQWQDCKIENEATRVPMYNDLRKDIANQLDFETLRSFEGFETCDLDYFIGRGNGRENILKKKIQLLVAEIRQKLLNKPRDFPEIDSRRLVVNLTPRGFRKDLCWFFVAEVGQKRLSQVPHFTFHIDEEGISCMLSLQSVPATNKFIEKLTYEKNKFLGILKRLHEIDEEYRLMIWEQIPEKGKPRRPQWGWHTVCSFNCGYIDQDVANLILLKLKRKHIKFPVVRILCPPIRLDDPRLYSSEIVARCTEWIKELQEAYAFLRK